MSRLRRAKLEVVLPAEHSARYRGNGAKTGTRVAWVEDIPAGRFFLRVGLGRKTTGSYYTPHAFVRFLVRETLAPQIAERSPDFDPNPAAILALKVIDPATGSGHFLVEACRYLAEALYGACRMCDEGAAAAETAAIGASSDDRVRLLARAAELRRRLAELPDPNGLLLAYLPSRSSEGGTSVFRNPVHWRSVDGWSPFIACMGWITTASPSSWPSCRFGWSPTPRDCR